MDKEIRGFTGILISEIGEQSKDARFEIVVPIGKYRLASDNLQPVGGKVTS